MKKIFLFFIILLYPVISFASIDERKIDVYFASGILTNEGNTSANTDLLRLEIISEIYNGNLNNFDKSIEDVIGAYNSTHGFFRDGFETFFQKFGWIGLSDLFLNGSHGPDLSLQVTAYQNSIKQGHKVLAVAHSQGNLFTREAYIALGQQSKDAWMQNYFNAVSIASPMSEDIKYGTTRVDWDNDPVPRIATLGNSLPWMIPNDIRRVSWTSSNPFGVGKPDSNYVNKSDIDNIFGSTYFYKAEEAGIDFFSNVHAFTFYMGENLRNGNREPVNPFSNQKLKDLSAKTKIIAAIDTQLTALDEIPSQWEKDKEKGCGCDKRITLKHISSPETMNVLVEDDLFYGFNETSGKVYDINGTYVKASISGTNIIDETADLETNGGICYNLEESGDSPITAVRTPDAKDGVVQVFLDWNTSSIDLDLNLVNWEGVGEYDIKDIGCPSEHFVIEEAHSVKEGRYFVEVNLKDAGEEDDNVSEDIVLLISVLGEKEAFKIPITEASELDIGKVAEIIIRYENEEIVVDISPDPRFPPLPSGSNGGSGVSRGCSNDAIDIYTCGCMPCSVRITPWLEQALAGPLSGADVELYIASEFGENAPLYVTQASTGFSVTSAGIISIPKDFTNALDDNELYIIHARGGVDIDSNDDFIVDTLTTNRGSLHTVIDGKTLKSYGYKINVLTEIAYQNVKNDIGVLNKEDILTKLDEITTLLLNGKIDADSSLSLAYEDIISWLPAFDKHLLYHDYNTHFEPIVQKIYKDEDIYMDAYDVVYGKSVTPHLKSKNFALAEDAIADTLIGKVEVLDEGESPIESLALFGEGNENFTINQDGEIRVSPLAQLNFETTKAYYLNVIAKNAQGESFTRVNIFIRDILDAPKVKTFSGGNVFSNAAAQTYVASVGFDSGTSPITEMTIEGNGNQYFDIDQIGNITVSAVGLSNIPTTTSFPLVVKAKNDSGYSRPVSITLYVIKVASIPSLQKFTGHIDENSVGGTLVGKISFEPGASAVNAFVLTGDGSQNFTVDLQGNIHVKDGVVLDYESISFYGLTISARNEHGTSPSSSVNIYIDDLEDVPVLKNTQEFSVDEDIAAGTLLGNVLQSPGLSPIESISSSGIKFRIDTEGNLYLKESEQLDYETLKQHTITAIATNAYGNSKAVTITIIVNDVIDVPTLTPLVTNVPENSPEGTVVGTISFTQGTSPIETMSFQGVSQEFSIDTMGVIRVKAGVDLDYENISSYFLLAFATNASGNSLVSSVTINIGNQLDAPELQNITYTTEENTQSIILPNSLIINEGLSPITSIEIFDKYGVQSTDVRSDLNGTVYITDTADLDFEKASSFVFSAKAYNSEGVSRAAHITLNLINVLDAPELDTFSGYVDENATTGTVVGQLNFNPGLSPVSSMRFYSSNPDQAIPFSIDKDGVIKLTSSLDYETITSYTFDAYATNEEGESRAATIKMVVNDVLDNPILHNLSVNVREDIHGDAVVGTISYQEGLDAISSMVLSGEGSEKFSVDTNGVIRLLQGEALDYESKDSYTLLAQAFSPGYNSNIIDVNIIVDDVDEYAEAGLGRWGDASVKIYKLEDNSTKTLMFSETTSVGADVNTTGLFDSHRLELEQDSFYLYEVSGGEDYDADNDGLIDSIPTPNSGTIHAVVKGSWVRDINWRPRVNLMTEVYYQWGVDEIENFNADNLENMLLNPYQYSLYLNKQRYYYVGNAIDAIMYNPIYNLEYWNPSKFPERSLEYLRTKIYENDPVYALFISNSFIPSSIIGEKMALLNDKSKLFYIENYYGLHFIDITGVTNPITTKVMSGNMETIILSSDDKYLFIQESVRFNGEENYSNALRILDVSNPLNPVEISLTKIPRLNNMRLSKNETKLYVTLQNNGLGMIDISDVTQPSMGTQISTPGQAIDLILSQDEHTAYMTDGRGGLQIIDISDSNSFTLLGEYITNGLVEKVLLSNDETKAYLTIKYPTSDPRVQEGHIHVINITDKSKPTLFAEFNLNTVPLAAFLFTSDESNMIIGSTNNGSKNIIYENVGQFQEMRLVGEIINSYSNELVLIQNETIMLTVSNYVIRIIDISDLANPIVIRTIYFETGG